MEAMTKKTRVENAVKAEMQRWIEGMITYCYQNAQIVGWDVVNEPMDDGKPSQIKTTPNSDVPNDAFYWQITLRLLANTLIGHSDMREKLMRN